MKTLAQILAWKFPDKIAGTDYIVAENENLSLAVELWRVPAPEPTPQRVAQWRSEFLQEQADVVAKRIEAIFRDEFSDVSKAVMAATFAGLLALAKSGEFAAAKILVNGASTVPPGVTQERFVEVKSMLLKLFP